MDETSMITNNYKKFLKDVRSIEKDAYKIKNTINEVSPNENINHILTTLNDILILEEKIKAQTLANNYLKIASS